MPSIKSISDCPPLPVVEGVEFRHAVNLVGYAVGSDGSFWSCRNTGKWSKAATSPSSSGCLRVSVNFGCRGSGRTLSLPDIVLESFSGARPEGFLACYLDGDESNTSPSNLTWVSPDYRPPLPIIEGSRVAAVPGHGGYYAVSEHGRVWTCNNTKKNKLACYKWTELTVGQRKGYPTVTMCVNFKHASKRVHSLILESFVGPPPDGHECRHLDGNKLNCQLSNLAWGTHTENMQDAVRHGTQHFHANPPRGEASHFSKLTEDDVLEIRRLRGTVITRILAERFGVSIGTIAHAQRGLSWTHVAMPTDASDSRRDYYHRGEEHYCAKLTEAQAREILRLKGRLSCTQIAKLFNCSGGTVKAIHLRKNWAHLTDDSETTTDAMEQHPARPESA